MASKYSNIKVSGPKDAEVEITGEISPEELGARYSAILERMRKEFELPGFRKGNVPMDMLKANINTHHALEDAAEEALRASYPEILEGAGVKAIGRPEVTILKIAESNPVEFKIRVGVKPEVKLPNYKKIAAKVMAEQKTPEVSEKEVEDVILTLRKMRAAPSHSETGEHLEPKPEDIPELTDEFVKTLGNFENVEDFKKKLKENLEKEKANEMKQSAREAIASKLAEEAKMRLPELLVADEAEEMFERLKLDLSRAGLSLEEYLKRSGKSEEDIRKEERGYAERQLATRFLLEAIAEAEKIEPDENDVRVESELMRERHPDLDPERIRDYIAMLLRNEKVVEFLESQKEG